MEVKKIGFIGVGTLGLGMINNLKKENKVVVYNRTREKAEEIGGIEVADTPKDLAEKTELIFVCISNDQALETVLFSDEGLFSADMKGKILVDDSTTSIEFTEKISKKAEEMGFDFLDAPVTGSKLVARDGGLLFMVGGKKEVFDNVVPYFKYMGQRFVYCGKQTNGQRAKHALNMTMSLVLQSYLEGMSFGIKAGVPREAMQEILDNSAAQNGVGKFKMEYILKRDFDPHFLLSLMHKDLKLADKDRKELGMYSPLADKITEIFDEAMDRKDEDVCTIVKTLEEKNNIKFE